MSRWSLASLSPWSHTHHHSDRTAQAEAAVTDQVHQADRVFVAALSVPNVFADNNGSHGSGSGRLVKTPGRGDCGFLILLFAYLLATGHHYPGGVQALRRDIVYTMWGLGENFTVVFNGNVCTLGSLAYLGGRPWGQPLEGGTYLNDMLRGGSSSLSFCDDAAFATAGEWVPDNRACADRVSTMRPTRWRACRDAICCDAADNSCVYS